MENLNVIGSNARKASYILGGLPADEKNALLIKISAALLENADLILEANRLDISSFEGSSGLKDRLVLTVERIKAMADAVLEIAELPDPVGEIIEESTRPNGLYIKKVRVPLGVIGIIYEARPNVTVDTAALCIKSGNAIILRGGKEAINSNMALTRVMQSVLPENAVQLITETSRSIAEDFMRLQYLDVLIPRGSSNLINTVRANATVPIIETGTGNCHVYVEKTADLNMAEKIIINSKCSRPSVCNACEKLLIDSEIADTFLPRVKKALQENGVEVLEENVDWAEEYLDMKIAVRVVSDIYDAIAHINKYSSKHSESIITQDKQVAQEFTSQIDSAAVYVNASTRFTDGGEFGYGAELGISTQKLHARGPIGLKELTGYKYIIEGNGQIR